jgi:hypothetical protein
MNFETTRYVYICKTKTTERRYAWRISGKGTRKKMKWNEQQPLQLLTITRLNKGVLSPLRQRSAVATTALDRVALVAELLACSLLLLLSLGAL